MNMLALWGLEWWHWGLIFLIAGILTVVFLLVLFGAVVAKLGIAGACLWVLKFIGLHILIGVLWSGIKKAFRFLQSIFRPPRPPRL